MKVNRKKFYNATVALSAKLATAEPGFFLSEQIGYLVPVLDAINVDLLTGKESIIELDGEVEVGSE